MIVFVKNYLGGAIIRSKATWYEKGEKSNKYFLNLESHNKAKSSVRKVFSQEGFLVVDPRKVLREIENFYSNLYPGFAHTLKVLENCSQCWKVLES